MIDYVKISILDIDVDRLLQLEILDFKREVSTSTGEEGNVQISKYHFCEIRVYDSGTAHLVGSIHKMFNSIKNIKAPNYSSDKPYKGFNGNDFTIENIFFIRTHLEQIFDCPTSNMVFQNMEYGYNLRIAFDPKLFITWLLFYKGKPFEFRHKGNYSQVELDRYLIKIYNKSKQYGLEHHTIRIEIKTKKSIELRNIDITTLNDINHLTLNEAHERLLKYLDNIVYYDCTIRKKALKTKDKKCLTLYSNQRYFLEELEPKRRDRPKKKLHQIISEHSDNLKQQIKEELIKKCGTIHLKTPSKKSVTIHTSNIEGIITKVCPVIGIDISTQKDCSYLGSNTGLKQLEKVNPEYFQFLVGVLITGKPNKFEKDLYSKLAKQVRNRYNNNKSRYNPNQLKLF